MPTFTMKGLWMSTNSFCKDYLLNRILLDVASVPR